MSWVWEYDKIKNLPLGHYDRDKFYKGIEKEYSLCRPLELRWTKKFPQHMSPNHAVKLLAQLTKFLKIPKIHQLVLNEKAPVAAFYYQRTIYFPSEYISTTTLLHEFTHHVCAMENYGTHSHGPKFCEMEELVFQAVNELMNS